MPDDHVRPPSEVQPDEVGVAVDSILPVTDEMALYYRSLNATAAQGVAETEKRLQAALLATVHTEDE
ncbi:hypothetical protein [Geminicoccus harenae]|uniref:hypothetical protein n=1 Tax=Geminicoccus harenae TaxID=2498453 RepID=UPI00168B2342|nr:hypothetical protein [Geminicoccus harenae]